MQQPPLTGRSNIRVIKVVVLWVNMLYTVVNKSKLTMNAYIIQINKE